MGSESDQLWPESHLNVIQKFLKTVNLCIIKTSLNPIPADPLPHTGVFYNNWNQTPISTADPLPHTGVFYNNWNLTPISTNFLI
jgi:hypothetical protein